MTRFLRDEELQPEAISLAGILHELKRERAARDFVYARILLKGEQSGAVLEQRYRRLCAAIALVEQALQAEERNRQPVLFE